MLAQWNQRLGRGYAQAASGIGRLARAASPWLRRAFGAWTPPA